MAFALPVDPTPTSVEALVGRLPARSRAAFEWFPDEFRRAVIAPLRRARDDDLAATLERVTPAGIRAFYRMSSATAALLDDQRAREALALQPQKPDEIHKRIGSRLAPLDQSAAENLEEAYDWLTTILSALFNESMTEVALMARHGSTLPEPADDEIARELRGVVGSFLRGLVLTIAALEVVLDEGELPRGIGRWCQLALLEVSAAANILRAHGIAIATSLGTEYRGHPGSLRLPRRLRSSPLPSGVMEVIVEELEPEEIWLFGSRARGTHGPSSDWDLLVVLPDSADTERVSESSSLASLRRQRVELVLVRRSDFEAGKHAIGSLADVVVREGIRVR